MTDQLNTHKTERKGTAVVTGASAGLGKVYADRLAKRGYDLVLVARSKDKLENLATSLRTDYGVAVRTLIADLSAEADLERVASDISADPSITIVAYEAAAAELFAASQNGKSASRYGVGKR